LKEKDVRQIISLEEKDVKEKQNETIQNN